jgi:deoxyribonuclease V
MKTPWNVSPKEAVAIQKKLRKHIMLTPLTKRIKLIGGADVSMNLFAVDGFAGFVTLSYRTLEVLDRSIVKQKPDIIIVDGVGIAHPRRMGIATHLGLVLGVPTIGCSKNVLTGTYQEPDNELGAFSYMYDPKNKTEIIGAALRTKRNVKPVFVSPGHLLTLKETIAIVRHCVIKHRLPEPTRQAHLAVNEYRVRG